MWLALELAARRSEEHTSELQSHRDLHSFPTRRSSDLRRPRWPGSLRLSLPPRAVRRFVIEVRFEGRWFPAALSFWRAGGGERGVKIEVCQLTSTSCG